MWPLGWLSFNVNVVTHFKSCAYGRYLMTATHNEWNIKWLTPLPILMQNHSGGDGVVIGIKVPPPPGILVPTSTSPETIQQKTAWQQQWGLYCGWQNMSCLSWKPEQAINHDYNWILCATHFFTCMCTWHFLFSSLLGKGCHAHCSYHQTDTPLVFTVEDVWPWI